MPNLFNRVTQNIKNFFITPSNTTPISTSDNVNTRMAAGGSTNQVKNLSNTLIPIQLPRIIQDIGNWRGSLTEAEDAWFPYRVKLQQMYIDTVNEPHTRACIEKRKNLTLLRKYALVDSSDTPNEEWTQWLQSNWFRNYVNDIIDALLYGYTLSSLGDVINNDFPEISIIRRWNISPDRLNVATVTYNPSGTQFLDGDVADWHIWIKTPSDIGVSGCGYGLLYPVSYCVIQLRNNAAFRASFGELFGMPIKVVKSSASNETERNELYRDLQLMGAAGGVVLKLEDEMELIEAKSGNGMKIYESTEISYQKAISKLLLGHSDALEPTVGKGLGSSKGAQNGQAVSEAQIALDEIQTKDAFFVEQYVEEFLIKARNLGISIPADLKFKFLNDSEETDIIEKQCKIATEVSLIVANFAMGGINVDPAYIEKITGFKVSAAPKPEEQPVKDSKPLNRILNANKPRSDEDNYMGSGHSKEEYEAIKTDAEYQKATKDFDGDRSRMNKDEYDDYIADVKESIENNEALDIDPGETCDVHINCGCYVDEGSGMWVVTDDNTCDDCYDAQEDYNSSLDAQNKLNIYNKHKKLT